MPYDLKSVREYFELRANQFQTSSAANAYRTNEDSEFDDEIYPMLAKEILRVGGIGPTDSVLDVGCGAGALSKALLPHVGKLVAVDISTAMVERTRSLGVNSIHYDGVKLPFADRKFDFVIIFSVLINLPTAEVAANLIREALRVTRACGCVFVGNIPMAGQAPFPTHDEGKLNWKGRFADALGFIQAPPIRYYSYSFSFFEQFMDEKLVGKLSLVMADKPLSGQTPKYHAIIKCAL